jgi:nicotinate phosphoribosyltransferase
MEYKEKSSNIETDLVNPLLTDFYQFSMIYAHWKNGRAKSPAVFDLYFRKCPFKLNVIEI